MALCYRDMQWTLRLTPLVCARETVHFLLYELFNLILSGTGRKPYLKVIMLSEDSGIISVISDRKEDPRGIIEVFVTPGVTRYTNLGCSRFEIRVTDSEFRETVRLKGSCVRY